MDKQLKRGLLDICVLAAIKIYHIEAAGSCRYADRSHG